MSDEDEGKANNGDDSDSESCQSDETRGTSNVQFSCAKSLAPIEDEEPLQPYYATTINSGGTVMADDLSSLGQRGIEDYSVASSRYPTSSLGGYKRREIRETVLEEDEDAYESSIDGRSRDSKHSKGSKSSKGSRKSSKSSRSSKSNESGKSKSSKSKRSRTKNAAPQEDASLWSEMSLDITDLSLAKQSSRTRGSGMSGSSDSGGKSSFNYQSDSTMFRGNDEEARRTRSGPNRPPPLTSFQRPSLRSQGSESTMSSFGLSTATPSSAGSKSRYASMRSISSDQQSLFSSDTNSMFFGSAATTSISEGPPTSMEELDDLEKTLDDRSASTAKTNQKFFDGVPDTISTGSSEKTRRKDPPIYPVAGAGDAPSVSSMQSNRDFFAGDESTGGGSTTKGGTLEGTINSTRSAGWSQYDDTDQDLSTLGTNQEFFERALPYQPGDGQSKGESKKTKDRASTPGSNTFRSEASVGWDDETMSTLDTKKKFFEKTLPWSGPDEPPQEGMSASPGFDQRTATPSSTLQNNTAYYEEDGTILTEGTGFWDANKPQTRFDEETAMETIQEDTLDSGSDTTSVSYTVSSRSSSRASSRRPASRGSSQHSYEAGKYSISSGSSRESPAIRSTRSRDSSSADSGIDRPTGVFMRPSHRQNTDPRKSISQEVEVSMDGFLHQSKPPLDDETVASSYEGMTEHHGEFDKAPWDRSNGTFHRILTLCSLSALVATALFFAVNIGPFYVQPPTTGRAASQNSQLATEGNNTVSQSELASEREVENFPHNIQRAYMDWRTPYGGPSKELPTLWSYEKSGAEIVENVFGHCLSRTQAGNGLKFDTDGSAVQAWSDEKLKIVHLQGQKFVNVDLETGPGMDRASRLGLATSGVADIAYTPLLQTSSKLFEAHDSDPTQIHGRLMVVFRDPIERAINRFEELKLRTQDNELTLSSFASSERYREDNPLTRALLGVDSSTHLSDSLLETAKEVVRRKVLVGLQDRLEETLVRWETYLSWYRSDTLPTVQACHIDVLDSWAKEYRVSINYAQVDATGFNYLLAQHRMDIAVYQFATRLYQEQGTTLFPQGIAA